MISRTYQVEGSCCFSFRMTNNQWPNWTFGWHTPVPIRVRCNILVQLSADLWRRNWDCRCWLDLWRLENIWINWTGEIWLQPMCLWNWFSGDKLWNCYLWQARQRLAKWREPFWFPKKILMWCSEFGLPRCVWLLGANLILSFCLVVPRLSASLKSSICCREKLVHLARWSVDRWWKLKLEVIVFWCGSGSVILILLEPHSVQTFAIT